MFEASKLGPRKEVCSEWQNLVDVPAYSAPAVQGGRILYHVAKGLHLVLPPYCYRRGSKGRLV